MAQYVVSARKYRPTLFNEVVGQQHVSETLKNSLRNEKLGQAYLFCGPRGVGKTTSARILAKTINCETYKENDFEPCGSCSACVAFQENASLNVHELDAASNNSVEDMRTLVEQVRYMPQQGKYKVYIIDEVHMLSQQAFNAFLKTLEEPPSYAIFILATTEKHKILPTILSRCQIFDFNRITVNDIVLHLKEICEKENIKAEEAALHVIAQKADGALRDALSIFDRVSSFSDNIIDHKQVLENLNILDHDYYFKLTDALATQNSASVLTLFNEILSKGFEGDIVIGGLSQHFRDLLVCKDPSTIGLLEMAESIKPSYQEQSTGVNSSFLLSALDIANRAELSYKTSKNKRLHIELSLLKICYLQSAVQISGSLFNISAPEKKN